MLMQQQDGKVPRRALLQSTVKSCAISMSHNAVVLTSERALQVSGSLIPMPTVAARDLWTCPLGEHPVTRPLPQESPLFLPLPETQNVTENAAARGNVPPEEDCLAAETAMGRLHCYLFHAGVISERPLPLSVLRISITCRALVGDRTGGIGVISGFAGGCGHAHAHTRRSKSICRGVLSVSASDVMCMTQAC